MSPRAAKLAAAHNVDASLATGTGAGGRITEKDVQALIDSGVKCTAAAPAAAPATAPAK